MLDHRVVAALGAAAQALHASARFHKQAEVAHRRQARQLMRTLEHVQRESARLGVELQITQAPEKGSHSDPTP